MEMLIGLAAAILALVGTGLWIDLKARRHRRALWVDHGSVREAKRASRARAAELGLDQSGIYLTGMSLGDGSGGNLT